MLLNYICKVIYRDSFYQTNNIQMKNIKKIFSIFLLSFLIMTNLSGQNFQIATQGRDYFFNKSNEIMAVRVDSSIQLNNGDTLYHHFTLFRDVSFNTEICLDVYGASLFGKTNLYRTDSSFLFFTKSNDTIIIKPMAQLNEKWTFFNWKNQDLFIEASITNISTQDVFGSIDDVKSITLLVKNSLNQNFVNHPLNQKVLYLSKNFGLLNTFDFYTFPDDSNLYSLIEVKPSIDYGLNNIKRIFDFNIGDEFHVMNKNIHVDLIAPGVTQIHDGQMRNCIKKVISKQIFNPDTAVTYQFERCEMIFNYFEGNVDTTYSHDTITETYSYKNYGDTVLNQLPWQTFPTQSTVYMHNILKQFYNNDYPNRIQFQYNHRNDISMLDTCWQFFNADPASGYTTYLEACGGPYYYQELWGAYVNVRENKLVYYKKGNETWGNPLAPTCQSLINKVENRIAINSKINIYPNPSSTSIYIELLNFNDAQADIEFYSPDGKLVLKSIVNTNTINEFSVDHFKNGVYLVKVICNNETLVSKIIIKP